jgi:tRNA A-37 threonylcarbamoyl transferase component Bud32
LIGIGSSVGHYLVRAKLGEGAMGTVYLAQHHVLDARVAIKVIRHDAERSEEEVSRFFTEARAASRIGHENIVSVIDFGRTSDGDPYYIMELLTGDSLAARLARGRWPVSDVLHVASQIADALAESHQKGIVHRDLKPGNVFLVRRGSDARFVKLLDFGVAKLIEEDPEDQRGHRTNTGRLLGTPHYMAPEQVAGRRTVDGRADVYALGVLLFEMVCGRLPFEAPKWTEVLIQHVTESPPRARSLAHECPAWLDRLIDRALAKSPQERPTMAEMREALRAQDDARLAPLPTSRSDAPTLAMEPPPRRKKRVGLLVTVGLGVGGTALGAAYVGIGGSGEPPLLAIAPAETPGRRTSDDAIERMRRRREELSELRGGMVSTTDAGIVVDTSPTVLPKGHKLRARIDAGTPLPERLDDFDVDHALAPTREEVAACNARYVDTTSLQVTLVVSGDGQVIDVQVGSEYVGTPFAMCLQRVISASAKFPPFNQPAQDVTYRYGFLP